jgi:mannonate dehydratase
MYKIMKGLIQEQEARKRNGRKDWRIPIRPYHGHKMLDDLKKKQP